MSDPPRLLDQGNLEADLLEAWGSMRAPTGARARALALGGLTATAAATTALGAKATAALGAKATATGGATALGGSAALTSATGGATGGATALGGSAALTSATGGATALGGGAALTSATGAATTATATGAGLLAAKWVAAIGLVAAIGGGSVAVRHRIAGAPTSTASATAVAAAHQPGAVSDQLAAPAGAEPAGATPLAPGSAVVDPANPDAPASVSAASDAPATAPRLAANDLPSPAARAKSPIDLPDANPHAKPATHAKPRPESAAAKPAPAGSLAAEVASLDTVRDRLRAGDPSAALRELDAFDANHPTSALTEDAAVLRFDAYVALGDRAGATRTANAVLARYPSSPRTAKVRRWLDAQSNATR